MPYDRSRPPAHRAGRACAAADDRRRAVDPAALHSGDRLGDDDRRRDVAADDRHAAAARGQAKPGRRRDVRHPRDVPRRSAAGRRRHARHQPGRDPAMGGVAEGDEDARGAGVGGRHSSRGRQDRNRLAGGRDRGCRRAPRAPLAVRRANRAVAGQRGGKPGLHAHPVPADRRDRRHPLRARRDRCRRHPPVRTQAGRRSRRRGGGAGRPGHPQRRARHRRDGSGAIDVWAASGWWWPACRLRGLSPR